MKGVSKGYLFLYLSIMFILRCRTRRAIALLGSFAPPKEMNQRKGVPKIQLKDFASHMPPRCKAQSPSVRTFLGFATALFQ
jgi:hypothetical protein